MEWSQLLSFLGTIVTAGFTAYTAYLTIRFNQETEREKAEIERSKSDRTTDAELRDDLMETIVDCNARNKELQQINADQQRLIDEERTKRRMQEMENDHFARKISRLEEENKILLERIRKLEVELETLKSLTKS